MVIGTRVQDETGRNGLVAGSPKLVEWDWVVAVKFDDGKMETVPESELTITKAQISVKAEGFAREARSAGWSALARNGHGYGVSIVSARTMNDTEIVLKFVGKRYDYTGSYAIINGKRRKVRNVSEAKRILAGLA